MISNNLETFGGLVVKDFEAGESLSAGTAYRLRLGWEAHDAGKSFTDLFDEFLAAPNASDVQALVIGDWAGAGEGNTSETVVESLVAKRDRLPKLAALFIGDMVSEECEISWITQSDMSPIWSAFPNLVELGIRGGGGLQLGRPAHAKLRKLVIETGGLPPQVVQELKLAQLPDLEHLELWLGTPNYGGDATIADLAPLLAGGQFPKLKYLGLRNSEIADEVAVAMSDAKILDQLEVLDLSLGTLSDSGVEALAGNQRLRKLKKLDIHHHYALPESIEKLSGLGIEIDATESCEADDYGDGEIHRYVYASE